MSPKSLRCPLCVDGNAPAGVHPLLGPVVVDCPLCCTRCPDCGSTALFPVTGGYALELLFNALDHLGVDIDACPTCLGCLIPEPLTTGTEVQP